VHAACYRSHPCTRPSYHFPSAGQPCRVDPGQARNTRPPVNNGSARHMAPCQQSALTKAPNKLTNRADCRSVELRLQYTAQQQQQAALLTGVRHLCQGSASCRLGTAADDPPAVPTTRALLVTTTSHTYLWTMSEQAHSVVHWVGHVGGGTRWACRCRPTHRTCCRGGPPPPPGGGDG
jgi:hypothetical protein